MLFALARAVKADKNGVGPGQGSARLEKFFKIFLRKFNTLFTRGNTFDCVGFGGVLREKEPQSGCVLQKTCVKYNESLRHGEPAESEK